MPADQGYLDQLAGITPTTIGTGATEEEGTASTYRPGTFRLGYSPSGATSSLPSNYWAQPGQPGGPGGMGATSPGAPYGNPPRSVPGMPGFQQIDDYYQSLIPVYQQQTTDAIGKNLAGAGFGGTRYGSAAANATADTTGRYQNLMQSQINQMRQGQINSDLDRALQQYIADQQARTQIEQASIGSAASSQGAYYNYLLGQQQLEQAAHQNALDFALGMGGLGLNEYNAGQGAHEFAMQVPYQSAMWENDIWNGQVNPLLQLGLWEQGRADDFSQMAFQDWSQNRYGMLPMLGGWASGISPGNPGQIVQMQTQPGQPGTGQQIADLWGLISQFF